MSVVFWHNHEQKRSEVYARNYRSYVVELNGMRVQIPQHVATPILSQAILTTTPNPRFAACSG